MGILDHDWGALGVVESLDGPETTEDRLRTLYEIVAVEVPSEEGIQVGLSDAVARIPTGEHLGRWHGRGQCSVDVKLVNPSRRARARESWGDSFVSFHERGIFVPVEFDIAFDGSDLRFAVESCRIAVYRARPVAADDPRAPLLAPFHELLSPRHGPGALERDVEQNLAEIGIDQSLIGRTVQLLLSDVFAAVAKDPRVREAIRDAYRHEEAGLPLLVRRRIYRPDVLAAREEEARADAERRAAEGAVVDIRDRRK
jgi:hypothetical protein